MGSRGFGASRRVSKGRLGSVSDYCVHHCVCPVVVVRFPDDGSVASKDETIAKDKEPELHTVPEEPEYHDASEEQKGIPTTCKEYISCFTRANIIDTMF